MSTPLTRSVKLKDCQTRLTVAQEQLSAMTEKQKSLDAEIKTQTKLIQGIHQEIAGLKRVELIVSEHAILRYLERVKEQDVLSVVFEIEEKCKPVWEQLGNCQVPIGKFYAVVKDGVVLTIKGGD